MCYSQFLMRDVDLIHRKRDREELTPEGIAYLVDGYTAGTIPDYQMSAFLMAVFFSGMTDREVSSPDRADDAEPANTPIFPSDPRHQGRQASPPAASAIRPV